MSPNERPSQSMHLSPDKVCAMWGGTRDAAEEASDPRETEQKGLEVGQETLQPAACLYDGLTPILEILFLIVKKDGEIIPHEISCPLSF